MLMPLTISENFRISVYLNRGATAISFPFDNFIVVYLTYDNIYISECAI